MNEKGSPDHIVRTHVEEDKMSAAEAAEAAEAAATWHTE